MGKLTRAPRREATAQGGVATLSGGSERRRFTVYPRHWSRDLSELHGMNNLAGGKQIAGCHPARHRLRLHAACVVSWLLVMQHPAPGITPTLIDAVPPDVAAVMFHAGPTQAEGEGGKPGTLTLAASLIDRAYELGLIPSVDPCLRMWADSLAATATVLAYPHAVVLFDVDARTLESGGHRLSSLHAALVIHAEQDIASIERRIQHLLTTYTNSSETTLSNDTQGDAAVYTLRDSRLPPWAIIQWGRVEKQYVVAIGEGSFARVTRTILGHAASLASDAWFREAYGRAKGAQATVAVFARFDHLQDNVDPSLSRTIARVRQPLRLAHLDKGLWTFRFHDRALEALAFVRHGETDELIPIAGKRKGGGELDAVIPESAGHYAVIDRHPHRVVRGFCDAFMAARSSDSQRDLRAYWHGVEEKSGVSFDRDLLSHLKSPVVVYDYPQHPLRLPFMWTILVGIDGSADQLRSHLDKLLSWIDGARMPSGPLRLRRADDGVWSLQFGLTGPSLAVTDKWLVISFSPATVRQAATMLASPTSPVSTGFTQ